MSVCTDMTFVPLQPYETVAAAASCEEQRLRALFALPAIHLFASPRCQLQCNDCEGQPRTNSEDFLKNPLLLASLHQIPPTHFWVSGGEPLIHTGLSHFSRVATECGHVVSLQSNTSISLTRLDSILKDAECFRRGSIDITHHLEGNLTFDYMKERVLRWKNAGIRTSVHYIARPDDLDTITEYCAQWRELGVAVYIVAYCGKQNGRTFPQNYSLAELKRIITLSPFVTTAIQVLGGIYSQGVPCRAGNQLLSWNNARTPGKIGLCCNAAGETVPHASLAERLSNPATIPCRYEQCSAYPYFSHGLNGAFEEIARWAPFFLGDPKTLTLAEAANELRTWPLSDKLVNQTLLREFLHDSEALPTSAYASPADSLAHPNPSVSIREKLTFYYTALAQEREKEPFASVFLSTEAIDINVARLSHLESLALPIAGKSVLEVGAGAGMLTKFFEDKGCGILSTEARSDNIQVNLKWQPHRQGRVFQRDLTEPHSHDALGSADICVCYGTLNHLPDPAQVICDLARVTREFLLLETCVFGHDNGEVNITTEDNTLIDQAYAGAGCRPGRDWIMKALQQYFPYVYITATQPDHRDFPLAWPVSQHRRNLQRSIFIASRRKIDSPLLRTELPKRQMKDSDNIIPTAEVSFCTVDTAAFVEGRTVHIDRDSTQVGGAWHSKDTHSIPHLWDTEMVNYFFTKTKAVKAPFCLDIGANTGCYCLLPTIAPDMRFFAFEPNPEVYRLLKNNLVLNKLTDKVQTFPIALSNKVGDVTLRIPASGRDSGLANMGRPMRFNEWREISVPVDTLDNIVARKKPPHIDFMKIDTGGCELFVLQGGEQCIRQFKPDILLEFYERNTAQFDYHPDAITKLLNSWGYAGEKISNSDAFFTAKPSKTTIQVPLTVSSSAMPVRSTAPMDEEKALSTFEHWIELLASVNNRLYYRDQSKESFLALFRMARDFRPTVIVELGTSEGMSLRTWLMATPEAKIKAIDVSFDELARSQRLISIDSSRVQFIKQNILQTNFTSLWDRTDRVLFFVNAHDLAEAPIMSHVLKNALPYLPTGSLVVIDDLWHCEDQVTPENELAIFNEKIRNEIDWLQLFHAHYAAYHAGGTFWGFPEVIPLMRYVNKHRIPLHFEAKGRHASFSVQPVRPDVSFDAGAFKKTCGSVLHHPLDGVVGSHPAADAIMPEVRQCYAAGMLEKTIDLLADINKTAPECTGVLYAMAIAIARQGLGEMAIQALDVEFGTRNPHPAAADFAKDLQARFLRHRAPLKARAPGLTLFAVPKPFIGHEGIIQRNALVSWTKLTPRPEIILLGNDAGVAEVCAELGLIHVPNLRYNDCGTPLLNDLFAKAQETATSNVLCYVNADIILFDDLPKAISLAAAKFENFLMVGRRWNYDQATPLDFSLSNWAHLLRAHATSTGKLHSATGMDYFAFRAGLWEHIPPFAIGRFIWDTWLLHAQLEKQTAVIDASDFVTILHQNHEYRHIAGGIAALRSPTTGIERNRNIALAEDTEFPHGSAVTHAPLALDAQGTFITRTLVRK